MSKGERVCQSQSREIVTDIIWINPKDIKSYNDGGMPTMKRKYGKFKRQITRQIINKDKSPLNSL